MVCGAGSSDPGVRQAALERLCAQYWYPLYAFLRRRGRRPDDAADAVQGLFGHLLEGGRLAKLEKGPGRFRNWLLTALQNHERDQHDWDRAQKRGGGRAPIPIDDEEGECRLALQGAEDDDPSVAFERAWALETLRMARDLLEQELRAQGKARVFAALADSLTDEEMRPRTDLAEQLGISPVALRVMLHRMRTRYRELLVVVVADSLGDRAEAGEELEELARALASNSRQSS
jgi:RNA polymerase sigma-70 factor (ECF subfamily)